MVFTPRGLCRLALPHEPADGVLVSIKKTYGDYHLIEDSTKYNGVKIELERYFGGELKKFSCPLDPSGTPFQQKVWKVLRMIPFGQTRSYGEVALKIGKPGAARAVGSACARNPIPILVSCHRVVGKDGSLVGYGGGLRIKKYLLELEKERAGEQGGCTDCLGISKKGL